MKFDFIGWCHDEKTNTDKVWIAIELKKVTYSPVYSPAIYATVWGRRGKKLQYHIIESNNDLSRGPFARGIGKLVRDKIKKGYEEIAADKLSDVYPEFEHELEQIAVITSFQAE